MTEKFWCPRRAESGNMPGPNGEPPRMFPDQDQWLEPYALHPASGVSLPYAARTCSYCGSWHPNDFFTYVKSGEEVGPTDKTYKVYLPTSPQKFYFQHLNEDARRRFVDLLNAKRVKLGIPGYFYVRPFFVGLAALLLFIITTPTYSQVLILGQTPIYLPDPAKTPGSVTGDDEATICGKTNGETYEKRARKSLTTATKRAITRNYGQDPDVKTDHELDHRVPAALGGRSDALNVWFEPGIGYGTPWTYELKDKLDTLAWREVCVNHTLSLHDAQALFLEPDWREPYCRIIGGPPCKELGKSGR